MESHCDYFMYFPAVPFTEPTKEPGRYRALPRRNHLYLGETVRFLLVLRCRAIDGGGGYDSRGWSELASSLSALASVSPGVSRQEGPPDGDEDWVGQAVGDEEQEEEEAGVRDHRKKKVRGFRECKPLLTHNSQHPGSGDYRKNQQQTTVEEPIILNDEVIFPLTVSLDRLPAGTLKAKIIVTVWKRDTEKVEIREHGYLTILQNRAPSQVFREEQSSFKAQVSTLLTVLPPPTVRCRQVSVSGKYITVLKVLNSFSQEEVSVRDIRILPNFNTSYLPMMPDGSVLLVDNVCHQSGDVSMASVYRIDSVSCSLPCTLSALEGHNFLFQLQVNERPQEDTREGLEVPLVAVVQWSTPKLPFTNCIYTHYRLPNIRLDRPRFVMMASCDSPVQVYERFNVTYTLLNNLQDFLAVRLVWTPENAIAGRKLSEEDARATEAALNSVVCHTPLNNLGFCRKGSTLTFDVGFQILRAGLFELSQHMKLKLQFTASVSNPPPDARPISRKNSPSSPAVRDLVERHQASLGRSQSFSHQQPSRSHLMRTGSVMERRAVTPPVGSPIGRPLYLPPERAVLSLDKIAKRECKVLVVDPIT
ncbi:trafficking protein particle complex subunit 14 [Protopterus annectens]|uniref:trafficking protein particle complex subunit 14 n=1 Tax=Protopterus annectens TaxID=7888 RepID=UPI001CF98426|nr:trafficking protein particle complex subunit 14 [Protopterus annectens]